MRGRSRVRRDNAVFGTALAIAALVAVMAMCFSLAKTIEYIEQNTAQRIEQIG